MTEAAAVCKQDVICILGMHRSGTSLLSRIVNLIGVHLGPDELLTTEPVADNPKGYWEHNQITAINDAILKRYGGSWDDPPLLPPHWEVAGAIDDLRRQAQQLIQDQFAPIQLWGWKDPRSCLTLPFWQQLLPDMRYIICLRNPVDVARSLERRDGLAGEKSFHLGLTYVASALNHSEGKPRLVIFYEDLVDDCRGELLRLGKFLGKSESAKQVDVQEAALKFVEKDLQHFRASSAPVTSGSEPELCARALYLAQRITVSFDGTEMNGLQDLANQVNQAMEVLTQYSIQAAGRLNLPEREQSRKAISVDTLENDPIVQRLSTQVAEQARTLKSQGETVGQLSAQLLDAETQLRKTFEWRLANRYAQLKSNFFKPNQTKSLKGTRSG